MDGYLAKPIRGSEMAEALARLEAAVSEPHVLQPSSTA
jgi:hypothetical protein